MTPDPRQFLPAFPSELHPVLAYITAILAFFGIVLWLAGARFSRSLITLLAVSLGASLGLHLPRWLALPLGTWATAVGGALVFGVLGYILHRAIIRIGLGFLMGVCGAVAAVLVHPPPEDWAFPLYTGEASLWQYAQQLWDSLPPPLQSVIPTASGAGLIIGFAIGTFLPRLALAVFYSVIGITLAACCGIYTASHLQPHWLQYLPAAPRLQLILVGGLVLLGAALQWWLSPVPASRRHSLNQEKLA